VIGQAILNWLGVGEDNEVRNPAPHEQWPEVMHWQRGDRFDFVYYRERAYEPVLISITEDGWAYCHDLDHRVKLPIRKMVGLNLSLQDRACDEELKGTNEYMELIAAFNTSFEELQRRDKGGAL
jgi:hypothetical protein